MWLLTRVHQERSCDWGERLGVVVVADRYRLWYTSGKRMDEEEEGEEGRRGEGVEHRAVRTLRVRAPRIGKNKKHQLSVHIRRVMHNCITKLSILPPMTDRINSSFSFSKLVTHVVCVNKSNKVTYEWISKTPSVFLSSWIYETWTSWGLSNFPGGLHGKIVWRKFFLKLLHVFTEHLNLFNKAFYPSSVD